MILCFELTMPNRGSWNGRWSEEGKSMRKLIDEQAAINALCKAGCDSTYCGVSCPDVMAIENLPSAQARERGTGRKEQ